MNTNTALSQSHHLKISRCFTEVVSHAKTDSQDSSNLLCGIGTIDRTLMQMKNEILEQNQIVLDYLLNSLLHGTPISQKDAERTGLVMNRSCQVYVWEQIPLTTNERAELVTSLKSQMDTVAFVTDLLGSDRRVIICQFLSQHDSQQLEAWI